MNKTVSTKVTQLDATNWAKYLNYGTKAALFAVFFIALTLPIENLEGKGMAFRAPLFLAPALLVPLIGKLRGWKPHTHLADALLTMPFLLDTLGNLFGWFDSFRYFDDVLHLVNWTLLVMAFHAFRFRRVNDTRDAYLLGSGYGALVIIAWELLEWLLSVDGLGTIENLNLSYGDTVGDLFMSTLGGIIGSFLAVRLLGPRSTAK